MIIHSIIAILTLSSVCMFWNNPYLLTLILFFFAIVYLYILKSKEKIAVFFICGILGATTEMVAIYFGAWAYTSPNIFGIPFWLVPLWGIASLFMTELQKSIEESFK